ncbi:hypothetical protein [Pleionea mediterranea]|uniref:Uncharacterized protein n=1 Tax=Pleionea mediterranea TaxID=523701 RepID=A0A316FAT2_9GAMM|nr:hypothetical protein [Pleionea mediterranea]PWK42553.1 hypothetical protein C8D97_11822 [Pleionea mediterranea]
MDNAVNMLSKDCDKKLSRTNTQAKSPHLDQPSADTQIESTQTENSQIDFKSSQVVDSHSSQLHQNIDRNINLLAKFISQLVESQRDFSEQLGVSYERVFTDGYEDFKGRNSTDVVRSWITAGPKKQVKLARLLADLSKHQLALVAAADGLVHYTVDKCDKHSSVFLNKKFKKFIQETQENPHKRFNELVAPGLASSYIKQREIQKSIK